MSNNKQSMKLYTESEVRKAIELSRDTHQEGKPYLERDEYDYSIDEVVDLLTPIKLPSDEEINEVAMVVYGFNAKDIKDVLEYKAFKRGAKWMRNKIQGGNNDEQ